LALQKDDRLIGILSFDDIEAAVPQGVGNRHSGQNFILRIVRRCGGCAALWCGKSVCNRMTLLMSSKNAAVC